MLGMLVGTYRCSQKVEGDHSPIMEADPDGPLKRPLREFLVALVTLVWTMLV